MLKSLKKREKLGITYFGLQAHEVAGIKSMLASAPDLADHFELRDPNHAGDCDIVVVNKDSQTATSWWENYKKRHPSAVPLFLTDSKEDIDDSTYCKRPFTPSFLQSAFHDVAGQSKH